MEISLARGCLVWRWELCCDGTESSILCETDSRSAGLPGRYILRVRFFQSCIVFREVYLNFILKPLRLVYYFRLTGYVNAKFSIMKIRDSSI